MIRRCLDYYDCLQTIAYFWLTIYRSSVHILIPISILINTANNRVETNFTSLNITNSSIFDEYNSNINSLFNFIMFNQFLVGILELFLIRKYFNNNSVSITTGFLLYSVFNCLFAVLLYITISNEYNNFYMKQLKLYCNIIIILEVFSLMFCYWVICFWCFKICKKSNRINPMQDNENQDIENTE